MDNSVFILGGYQTDFSRNFAKEGKNEIALLKETMAMTLKDSGLSKKDLRELANAGKAEIFEGNFISELYCKQGHLDGLISLADEDYYGIPVSRTEAACASSSSALDFAISKIRSGDIDIAVVIGWELMKTVSPKECGDILGYASYRKEESQGIAYPFPKLFGRLAEALVEKYHLEKNQFLDDLARISVNNYACAKNNPNAQTRLWFMDLSQAKMRGTTTNPCYGGMLAVSDFSQVTDGAAGVVICSEKYLEQRGFSVQSTPCVLGYSHKTAPMLFSDKMKESCKDTFILPWTRKTCVEAYQKAGLSFQDIDVFEVHDCFTSSEYAELACLGFCAPGDEHAVIQNGTFFINGAKPINPSGGLIGCGHPVGASGVRMFLDCYKQVAHKAGSYQIAKAKTAMMLNIGGSATSNYAFIVGFRK